MRATAAANLVLAAAAAVLVTGLGWWAGERAVVEADATMRRALVARASTVGAAIDPAAVAALRSAPDDEGPGRAALVALLRRVRSAAPDVRHAYLLVLRDGRAVFLADAETPGTAAYSPPGHAYSEASADVLALLRGGPSFAEGPLPDEYGVWVSAFAPVSGAGADALPAAVVGLDVEADSWSRDLAVHRVPFRVAGLLAAALLTALVLYLRTRHAATEALAAEVASLRRAEETLRLLDACFRQSDEAALVTDAGSSAAGPTIVFANPAFCRLSGYAAEELVGRPLDSLYGPGPRRAALARIQTEARAGRAFAGEVVNRRKDGTDFLADTRVSPIRDAAGRVTHLLAFQRDITLHKADEALLRRRDQQLAAAAEAAGRLLAAADLAVGVQAALEVIGRASDVDRVDVFECHEDPATGRRRVSLRFEWTRPGQAPLAPPRDGEGHPALPQFARWHQELEAGRCLRGLSLELPEDERAALEALGVKALLLVPILLEGRLVGFMGFNDCSSEREWSPADMAVLRTAAGLVGGAWARRTAADAVRLGRERLRVILEAAPDGIVTVDEQLRVESFSPAAERIFGRTAAEVVGRPVIELTPESFRQHHEDYLERCLRSGAPLGATSPRELVGLCGDGRALPLEVTVGEVVAGGRRLFTGVVRDVAVRKQLEEERAGARARELQIGARIQRSLLLSPPPADALGCSLSALTIPSLAIDGDFYEFLRLGPSTVDVLLGDVMGKGVPAALIGAATKGHFVRALGELQAARPGALPPPEEVMARLHRAIAPELMALDSFVTAFYARIDAAARRLEFLDCGHTTALLLRANGSATERLSGDNVPLGFLRHERYSTRCLAMAPGDTLFLYSDGATEARSPSGEQFGLERLVQLVERLAPLEPSHLLRRATEAVLAWAATPALADDLTCLIARLETFPLDTRLICFERLKGHLGELRAFAQDAIASLPADTLTPDAGHRLVLAVHEVASNLQLHAYEGQDASPVALSFERHADRVRFRFRHQGAFFAPAPAAPPAFDGTQEHGFGLYLIDAGADVVDYAPGWTEGHAVVLTKYVGRS